MSLSLSCVLFSLSLSLWLCLSLSLLSPSLCLSLSHSLLSLSLAMSLSLPLLLPLLHLSLPCAGMPLISDTPGSTERVHCTCICLPRAPGSPCEGPQWERSFSMNTRLVYHGPDVTPARGSPVTVTDSSQRCKRGGEVVGD